MTVAEFRNICYKFITNYSYQGNKAIHEINEVVFIVGVTRGRRFWPVTV